MRQKHIVIDARYLNSSTGRYFERLITYLQDVDSKNNYSILVRKKDLDYWKPKRDNFKVIEADFPYYSFAEQFKLLKLLHELKPDLVHYCMPQQPLLYFGRHVTTIQDMTLLKVYNSDKNWLTYRLKQFVGRAVFQIVGRTSRHLIAISEFTKNEYAKYTHIPENKLTVTYESADVLSSKPVQPSGVETDESYLLYVGSQSDYKNIRRLMQTHQALKVDRPELKLVLVGSLNEAAQRNKSWAEEKGLLGIIFTGFVSDDELAWLYAHCQAYVFPSLMEGFGLPGLEAMVHKAPVVSSNATCLPEVYGDAAIYFDPTSVQDMTTSIAQVIDSDTTRQNLIKKGTAQAKKYSWKRMAEQTHAVYMKALSE